MATGPGSASFYSERRNSAELIAFGTQQMRQHRRRSSLGPALESTATSIPRMTGTSNLPNSTHNFSGFDAS